MYVLILQENIWFIYLFIFAFYVFFNLTGKYLVYLLIYLSLRFMYFLILQKSIWFIYLFIFEFYVFFNLTRKDLVLFRKKFTLDIPSDVKYAVKYASFCSCPIYPILSLVAMSLTL
jgi:hypothetical protein